MRISEYMFSTIQSQPAKYDLIVAEDALVSLMKKLRILSPLDHNKIPNLKYLKEKAIKNFYDRGATYCLPYVHGYTGIAINEKHIKDYDGTRKILWDKKYKGKISTLNPSREILINILYYLGSDSTYQLKSNFKGYSIKV